MQSTNNTIVEQLLEYPYWIIDILPSQVPDNGKGKYFDVEKYFLKSPQVDHIFKKFANLLLKLNCYENLDLLTNDEGWLFDPNPETLVSHIMKCPDYYHNLIILLKNWDAMITLNGDDTYMTIYNLNAKCQKMLEDLATSEGLFLWKNSDNFK